MDSPVPAIQAESDKDISSFLKPLALADSTIYDLAHRFSTTFKELAANSPDLFFPTPVTRLPTGHETGNYLAAYVGLSYLRVAFIDLLGESAPTRVRRTLEKAWPIEERLKRDNAKDLFAWIGDCIAEVVADGFEPLDNSPSSLDMGISFCFPTKQETLHEAVLMPTDKGFALSSDLDLRQALLDGYERHTRRPKDDELPSKRRRKCALPKLRIAALTNDTVATLASLAYSVRSLPNSRVAMGLIVGSGSNATIPMKFSSLNESKTRQIRINDLSADEVLVSTEWTMSGAAAPLRDFGIVTKWDSDLESASSRPGFQPLEYMVGGRYIGELVRIITCDYLTSALQVSRESLPSGLVEPYDITTDFLSFVVSSSSSQESLVDNLRRSFPPPSSSEWEWNTESAGILRKVASAVQARASALVAAAIIGLLAAADHVHLKSPGNLSSPNGSGANGTGQTEDGFPELGSLRSPEELVVAVSGGVIQHYPKYKEHVQRHIDQILVRCGPQDGGKSVFLREASDGGIIGVGVLAGTTKGKVERIIGSAL